MTSPRQDHPRSLRGLASLLATAGLFLTEAHAKITPNPLFSDHAVVQAGIPVPVWGSGDEGEHVVVELAGAKAETVVKGGKWLVRLPALRASGPQVLKMTGTNTVVADDVLVGEVWLAGGQSNMERQLGPRPPQKPIENWEEVAAAARLPQIRQFQVAQTLSAVEAAEPVGKWVVCTPDSVKDFSAVGYFFAHELEKRIHRPIGIIHSSWGGTPAESWMSRPFLAKRTDFKSTLAEVEAAVKDPAGVQERYRAAWDRWYKKFDEGSKGAGWHLVDFPDDEWSPESLPGYWETHDMPDFDGIVWYSKSFSLPEDKPITDMVLHLGAIDDNDTTWVNGRQVGATEQWDALRLYRVPAAILKPGRNMIMIRVADTGGNGGLSGGDGALRIEGVNTPGATVILDGVWKRKIGSKKTWEDPVPVNLHAGSPAIPGILYNGMIAPLVPYGIKGVIWYQGEANVGREAQYRTLFPDLIGNWRSVWGQGDFPFLFVQIAPFKSMTPEIREAQFLTLGKVKHTAMAVTIDCGDAEDIHPARKEPVGFRLAAAAEALAYGGKKEYSGPLYSGFDRRGNAVRIHFSHTGGGLVFKGGSPKGVEAFDASGKPVEVKVSVDGTSLVVAPKEGAEIANVRYAWANVPEGNLFNNDGFPASPFRTDAP